MLLEKKDNIAGHSAAYILQVTKAHIDAYQHDDMDRLMATVSPHGGIWAGLLPPEGAVIMRTFEEIREGYRPALAAINIGPSQPFVSMSSDWYVIVEGITQLTDKASGHKFEMAGLGVFGADDKALAIDTEIGGLVVHDRVCPPGLSINQWRLSDFQAHQRRLDAICVGDIEAALVGIGERIDLFLPCFDPNDPTLQVHVGNRDAYRAYLKDFLQRYRVQSSRSANRMTTHSWVFSEVEWVLTDQQKGGNFTIRFALLEALGSDNNVRGAIGIAIKA